VPHHDRGNDVRHQDKWEENTQFHLARHRSGYLRRLQAFGGKGLMLFAFDLLELDGVANRPLPRRR
jgi:hypothetical protein